MSPIHAAASAAAAAAATAAAAVAKAGASPEEQDAVAHESMAMATAKRRILDRRLSATETRRLLDELWISQSMSFIAAISDPTRMRMVSLLRRNEHLTVGAIAKALGLGASTASAQLARLRNAKLVAARREHKEVHYSLQAAYLSWKAKIVVQGLTE